MTTANTEQIDEALMYLRCIASLLAMSATDGLKQKEKIEKLVDAGLASTAISQTLGLPMSTVSPVVSRYKGARSRKASEHE